MHAARSTSIMTDGTTYGVIDDGEHDALDGTAYVVSLGALCITARLLQQHNLRVHASPFDWVFSSPEMVRHCLEDSFATFLDSTQYVPVEDGHATHRLYSTMIGHSSSIFNHHNPITRSDYDYFQRCVERFELILCCRERHKLFLLVSKTLPDLQTVQQLFEALRRRTANFELCVVGLECHTVDAPVATLTHEATSAGDGATLRVWTQQCRGWISGVAFIDSMDAACFAETVLPSGSAGRRFSLAPDPLPVRRLAQADESLPRRRVSSWVLKRAAKLSGLDGPSAWHESSLTLHSAANGGGVPLCAPESDEEAIAALIALATISTRAACLLPMNDVLRPHLDSGTDGIVEIARLAKGLRVFSHEEPGPMADDPPILRKGPKTKVVHVVVANWSPGAHESTLDLVDTLASQAQPDNVEEQQADGAREQSRTPPDGNPTRIAQS
eukprot:4408881-Prymnesium_polylepis.2